jgi:hypothetical protein
VDWPDDSSGAAGMLSSGGSKSSETAIFLLLLLNSICSWNLFPHHTATSELLPLV